MKELIFYTTKYRGRGKRTVADMKIFIYYISTIFNLYEDNTTALYFQI